ncbi:MAG: hypothetical protein AMXMBFR83_05700 [Phycisphaerae bacterium]
MGILGVCILAVFALFAVYCVLAFTEFPELLLGWGGWLILAVGVFGLAVPLGLAALLVFCHREFFGTRPAWLSSAFLAIHWLVYVPYVVFAVAPPLAAVWPWPDMQDPEGRFLAWALFALGAGLPAQLYLAFHWPFPARPRPERWFFPAPLPHVSLRRKRVHS